MTPETDARTLGYLPFRAEWAEIRMALPDDAVACERCREDVPAGAFYILFVALPGHDIAEPWDHVAECRTCASRSGFAGHFDGLPENAAA